MGCAGCPYILEELGRFVGWQLAKNLEIIVGVRSGC